MATKIQRFKGFSPLTNSTESMRPKMCARNFVMIDSSIRSLQRSQAHEFFFRHHLVRVYRSLVQQFEAQTHHKDCGQAKSQFTLKLLSNPGETPARDSFRPRPHSSSGLTPPLPLSIPALIQREYKVGSCSVQGCPLVSDDRALIFKVTVLNDTRNHVNT